MTPERKTAEATWLSIRDDGDDPIETIKAYARQEVEKHLQLAADSATVSTSHEYSHRKEQWIDNSIVDRESITGIEITLT